MPRRKKVSVVQELQDKPARIARADAMPSKKRGRPKGSKNEVKRAPGRPKGSRNKPVRWRDQARRRQTAEELHQV